ncbi:MAG: glycosyltransferase family 2 protein [Daejeonella sp.]
MYPLVSIVMCVYKGERYLRQQIESILAQTYPEIELLILDDLSTDSSIDIINESIKKDSRIRLVQNTQNLGFNKNFEKGFSLSRGELIAISDQDDIWLPDKISRLVENLGDHILIYSNSTLIDEQGDALPGKLDTKIHHIDQPGFKAFLDDNFITGHTCLFKRELLNYILPFPGEIFFYDWWLGFTAAYVGQVKYLDEALTRYRVHSQSVCQQLDNIFQKKTIWAALKRKQTEAFAAAPFLKSSDANFIHTFLNKTGEAKIDFISFLDCYYFMLKNGHEIYPWYKKSRLKKLNFLRKKTLGK